ncbi:MCE family protein [Amycolatopsis umgeniensis]|uniref:Virulence factor Mce-like protein n=1 Tax=Amycolatopsis umgeniensis TaxID=336628 RepID=A0A841AT18_9PSEU|nr:MCE family protein [Amycolatopsis umgeniensis]MBB5851969.1 virulence factor Mce-like protein [Amycolatopsis umgeniensis]
MTSRFVTLALVLALAVVGGLWWIFSGSGLDRVTVYFSRAVGVYSGSDVRVLGVRVGQVESVAPEGEQVKVVLTVDGSTPIATDTNVLVVAPSVVADRYVQFTKLTRSGNRLDDGAVIPVERTGTPVELDQLYSSLDTLAKALGPNGANADGALSDLLRTGAKNLQGNGKPFNESVRNFADLARTLSGNSQNLFATVDELQRFTSMLATNDRNVSEINKQLASVTGTLAQNKNELARALNGLGGALAEIQQFIRDNRALIKSNVDKLAVTTGTLVDKRAALAETLDTIPLAVTNVLEAIDPKTGKLQSRGNLLEYAPLPLPVAGATYTGGR